ncbi:MAG: 2-keto-4-pentenoate hydratase [bacterium]|nr:2-keto-4-pentenoate hydratase [Deltaproteobacteria bacterium]MCP4904165.1 2-keto-4-pentenoate hydratase [bacterium]
MASSESERTAIAKALARAERTATPIDPLQARWPGLDVHDAYEIQRANIESRVAEGALIRGHKVGLSSRAMQEMMGVDECDYGHLMDDMFVFEGDTIETAGLCLPRVEVEVAFVLGHVLPGRTCHVADVLRATEFVLPALEIIDSRIRDWKIGLVDTIADNASSCRVVLGGNPTRLTDLDDLRRVEARLAIDGKEVARGCADAVLGNPASAVAWLARKLDTFGVCLSEGDVILPGSCTRAFDADPGCVARAEFDGLGAVEVGFA